MHQELDGWDASDRNSWIWSENAARIEGLLRPACGSGARDQPSPDVFGGLVCRPVLAVPADPAPPPYLLLDEFDAARRPTALLQTDANVGS